MPDSLALTGTLAHTLLPAAILVVAALVVGRCATASTAWRVARAATAMVAVAAVAVGVARVIDGVGADDVVRLDSITAVMLSLVAIVGWVVVRFSATYLAGDLHEQRYAGRMLATLAAVSVVVVANHLVLLVVAWTATSVALHGLLTFFGDRPVAVAVAHKKFLLARCADACMVGATVAFGLTFDTLRIDEITAAAATTDSSSVGARLAIVLVALAALLKCAQLPFHGWLIQVMEAPTPVSALLHAGVVNLGGFVLLRFAPVVDRAVETRTLLVVVGVGTAVVASLVMTTRVSVKVALAWSTCAQMGFMLMQCGLGLWEMALLHLVAHSLYKAHAFLSAGGTVRQTQRRRLAPIPAPPTVRALAVATTLALDDDRSRRGGVAVAARHRSAVGGRVGPARGRGVGDGSVRNVDRTDDLVPASHLLARTDGGGARRLPRTPRGRRRTDSQGSGCADRSADGHRSRVRAPVRPAGRSAVDARWPPRPSRPAVGVRRHVPRRGVHPHRVHRVSPAGARRASGTTPPPPRGHQGARRRRARTPAQRGERCICGIARHRCDRSAPRMSPHIAHPTHPADASDIVVSTEGHDEALGRAIDGACDRIAPTWPLDQFIAVNPYWGWRSAPIADAAARLGALAGTTLTMPRSWFRDEWRAGRLADRHVRDVAAGLGSPELADVALAMLAATEEPWHPPLLRFALVTDLRDEGLGPVPGRTWTDLVVHQISQLCAAHFDEWQASWAPDRTSGLFGAWRDDPSVTHGFSWRRGREWARTRIDALPTDSHASVARMLDDLRIAPEGREAYLTGLLCSVNGWAAWCAYRRWQARLADGDDDSIVDLLAIRLAWEWLLAHDFVDDGGDEIGESFDRDSAVERLREWAASWTLLDEVAAESAADQRVDWVVQTALERTYQDSLIVGLPAGARPSGLPAVQAAFCIDVRSEVFRRALESTSAGVRTRGFAGFFGLPIAYTPAGSALTRPQLPGLLAPALQVTDLPSGATASGDHDPAAIAESRIERLQSRERRQSFRRDPSSMFTYVESMGLLAAIKLVKESLPHHHAPEAWEHDGLDADHGSLRPRLALVDDDPAAAAAIGHRVLTAMGLVDSFAPLVLLCGHGSTSANNPHAAGLDCGACGGQTGEVNARVLADLLNSSAVRDELSILGIDVPATTWFVPGLHDTTTDVVQLFDTESAPTTHAERIAHLGELLRAAGDAARSERASGLGLDPTAAPSALAGQIDRRANDWSQVRPEWGLAGNAAFVVAPRWRTSHLDLGGRAFLHDYDWRIDPDRSVLTQIMTAPMVVTNWINLQYHASTVDNRRYGSGDKVLHNVVGGRIGVFEGNGGDLRIGLSMQSLTDGTTLRHRPLRLSVFVEAPRSSIDSVIAEQPVVQQLVLGGWLHLLRIDPEWGTVERRSTDGWEPCDVTTSGR